MSFKFYCETKQKLDHETMIEISKLNLQDFLNKKCLEIGVRQIQGQRANFITSMTNTIYRMLDNSGSI